jgi:hypothetical protein
VALARRQLGGRVAYCWIGAVLTLLLAGCRVPAIDPSGSRIFLPHSNSTSILHPHSGTQPAAPTGPVFQAPPDPVDCSNGHCGGGHPAALRHLSHLHEHLAHQDPARSGQLIMTPSRIIAPVGSEVVVLAGICGGDGYYVINQPVEWMLSSDSAGRIIEVGGTEHSTINALIPPSARKVDGEYAWGRTALKPNLITRGTPTTVDDLQIEKGQAWISLSSASEGTSYLTCVAPKTEAWDRRRASTIIHWIDAMWMLPAPSLAPAGSTFPLTVAVNRTSDGSGVAGWRARYQIIGGAPAEFLPGGTQTIDIETDSQGRAVAQLRQPTGVSGAGATQVRIDVVRPGRAGEREVIMESGITTITWSAPALTIRAIGPRSSAVNQPFNYRLEISNPGDQLARGVVVQTDDVRDHLQFISSEPKPVEFGNQLRWELGDLPPGSGPRTIDLQVRSDTGGLARVCFEVLSQLDQLQTEACAETEIAAPCLALAIDGPTEARVGDTITFNLAITNQCAQDLTGVTIRVEADLGLAAPGISMPLELGPLAEPIRFGETRQLAPLTFEATASGAQCFSISASATGGHTATARRCVQVTQLVEPKVRLLIEGQRTALVGEEILARMTIQNVGNVPLDGVSLITQFSPSLVPIKRTPIQQTWVNDDLAFDVGRLEVGGETVVEVVFEARQADGNAFARAIVSTPQGASDTVGVTIRIDDLGGNVRPPPTIPEAQLSSEPPVRIPADASAGNLNVRVAALQPSASVNQAVEFQVTVTNGRATSDQDVRIALLTPPGTQLLQFGAQQAGLAIASQSPDRTIHQLEPRRELRAGESITFPVVIQATQMGQATLTVQAVSVNSIGTVEGRDSVVITP